MGSAISYALNNWGALKPLLNDAKVRLDNNVAENALRIIALGQTSEGS